MTVSLALAGRGGDGRLPRPEPRDGLAVRRLAGPAGAQPQESPDGAVADCRRPSGFNRDGCRACSHGARWPSVRGSFSLSAEARSLLFGAFRLFSSRFHYRWVGMRVSSWDLVVWSFLMASARWRGPDAVSGAPQSADLHHDCRNCKVRQRCRQAAWTWRWREPRLWVVTAPHRRDARRDGPGGNRRL